MRERLAASVFFWACCWLLVLGGSSPAAAANRRKERPPISGVGNSDGDPNKASGEGAGGRHTACYLGMD